jgi:HAD superfamily hydrolase (TIGR01549 family)
MQMMSSEENQVAAILWDYDGTLVDSARKNMKVTIEVLRHFDPDIEDHIPPALQSYDAYQEANHRYRNWRELYTHCYGIPFDKLDEAGRLWAPEQERNKSIPDMFPGLADLLATLKGIPMGICSQNASENIWHTLSYYGVADYFRHVVGFEDVPGNMQKPHSYGFVKCAEALNPENKAGTYIYIGDHSDDVTFGKNGEAATGHKVICITADYLGLNGELYSSWKTAPNYYVRHTNELKQILVALLKQG